MLRDIFPYFDWFYILEKNWSGIFLYINQEGGISLFTKFFWGKIFYLPYVGGFLSYIQWFYILEKKWGENLCTGLFPPKKGIY
jgi:hypothetical protein